MSSTFLIIFIVGTIAISAFTWQFAITKKRSHGLPRFFAFESILLLALLNAPVWFEQPLAWNQIISWILLFTALFFAIDGFILLHRIGKPQGDFENTAKLVAVGLYRFIRHPLYASLMLLGFGVFFKDITVVTSLLALINFAALAATAKIEEREMLAKFGEEYTAYMKKTKMFIPFVV